MPERITFTRAGAHTMNLRRAHAPGWAVEVWRDEPCHPIVLHRHSSDRSIYTVIHMTEAQARAIAAELLHAADVAQQADTNTPQG